MTGERMNVGSVFSGIGGFDEGFRRAGFGIAWMCEREPFCRTVLARHFPDVPCFDDVTTLVNAPEIDVLVGGFPCQDVSVAGQRRGLAGERSGLFYEFMRLVDRFRPNVVVLENVPGLFSSHGGRDFYAVLQALAERGLRRSYRVLDSQYFGVPQRRRRVFLVSSAGGFLHRPEAILFESASRVRDSAKGEQARARVAACLRGRSHGAGVNEPGRGGEDDSNLVTFDWQALGSDRSWIHDRPGATRGLMANKTLAVAYTLRENERNASQGPANYIAASLLSGRHGYAPEPGDGIVVNALCPVGGGPDDNDAQAGHLVASPITASAGHHGHSSPRGDGRDNIIAATLAQHMRGQTDSVTDNLQTVRAGVRRLTPLECERLQGFPDGWTCLCGEGHRGSQYCSCPDTPRYKALGNAVTVPVAEWIARRLMAACQERVA